MILVVLFVVVMALWFFSAVGTFSVRYSGLLPWVAVLLIFLMTHAHAW